MSTTDTSTPVPAELPAELVARLRHPTGRAMRAALVTLAASGILAGTAGPASAAGSVANSCAAIAQVEVQKKTNYNDGGTEGITIEHLDCGEGTSGVWRLTVRDRPYTVKVPNRAPMCRQAGQWFYPYNSGAGKEAVVSPTVRCR